MERARTSRVRSAGLVGAVALFLLALGAMSAWPSGAWSRPPPVSPYVVAIPASGPQLSSPVHHIFGRAPQYLVVDLRTSRSRWIQNEFAAAQHAVSQDVTHLLVKEQVGVVVAQSIGPETFRRLAAHGVRVLGGHPSTVGDALRKLGRGGLEPLAGPTGQLHDGLSHQTLPAGTEVGMVQTAPFPAADIRGLGVGVAPTASTGVVVTGVQRGSGAELAGLRAGDVILQCGRTPVGGATQLQWLVAPVATGYAVPLTVLRNGRVQTVSVVKRDARLRGTAW